MNLLGFAVIAWVLLFVMRPRNGYVRLSLKWPVQTYCLLFALYYVIPLGVMAAGGEATADDIAGVLTIYGMALACLLIGSAPAWTRVTAPAVTLKLTDTDSLALLLVGLVLVAGNVAAVWWRVSNGFFFTHARYYEQELTLSASFRDVFVTSLQLPLLLIFGGCTYSGNMRIVSAAKRVLQVYAVAVTVMFALSSQTRPAVTAVMFFWLGVVMYSARRLSLRSAGLAAAIVAVIAFAIQTTRFVARDQVAMADNQLVAAAQSTLPSVLTGSDTYDEVLDRSASRAAGGAIFLIDIIAATAHQDYLYGSVLANDLAMAIPRLFWPDKPAAVPMQIFLQRSLGLYERDAPASPVVQAFAAGGLVGVAIAHLLLGALLWATTRVEAVGPMWIVAVACLWGALAQVEVDLIASLIGAVRNTVVLLLMFGLCRLLCRDLLSSGRPRLFARRTALAGY
jgi:hypothetical protein